MENFAQIRKRIFGGLIDHGLVMTMTIIYISSFGHPNEEGGLSVEGVESLPVFLFWLIYFPVIEGMTGQTLGKKLMGIRVVTLAGGQITFGTALVRHIFDIIDVSFAVGILVMKSSDKRQRIGDLIAKTVVREETYVLCERCREELQLSPHEQRIGQFTCPNCRHENKLERRPHLTAREDINNK
jgi:uncharacterized RDD family membrane protein YckC